MKSAKSWRNVFISFVVVVFLCQFLIASRVSFFLPAVHNHITATSSSGTTHHPSKRLALTPSPISLSSITLSSPSQDTSDPTTNPTFSSPPIDAVYTYVDIQDIERETEHLMARMKGIIHMATSEFRLRDSGTLRFSLRALNQNAPWVRKVFIVTNGQSPPWLNLSTTEKKVVIVSHKEIFPDSATASCLPTFNSNAIESVIHRIPGLSEPFLYLNDDVFIWRPLNRSFFVHSDGKPLFRMTFLSHSHHFEFV